MVDPHYLNGLGLLVYAVDDPIDAASGSEVSAQLSEQRLADSMWVIDQGSDHEFNYGGCDLRWESTEPTFG